jgi:hypothetical protein
MSKQYGKNSDEINAVIDCHSRKLSYSDAVKELNAKGFAFSEKRYQRMLAYVKRTMPQRLDRFSREEYQTSIISSVNTIDHLLSKLRKAFDEAKDEWKIIQLASTIIQCLITREKFFEASPVVASLAKRINKTG